jgi:hypothetical protein
MPHKLKGILGWSLHPPPADTSAPIQVLAGGA